MHLIHDGNGLENASRPIDSGGNDGFFRTVLDHIYDGVYFVNRSRQISFWNKSAERITGYGAEEVVGKKCAHNILMHVDHHGKNLCTGRCPLSDSMTDGEPHVHDLFLLHKNGHRVPITVRVTPIRDAAGKVVGAVEIFTDNTSKAAVIDRLAEFERMAYMDEMTGVANRRYMEIALASRLEELQRYGWPFGLIFIDIDNFKKVNDRYGHPMGDEVLRMVARTIATNARTFDVAGRWGGEEFAVVVANVNAEELRATAERFRFLVEKSRLPGSDGVSVTISLGAVLARKEESAADVLGRADRLLYASKAAGKNRCTCDDVTV